MKKTTIFLFLLLISNLIFVTLWVKERKETELIYFNLLGDTLLSFHLLQESNEYINNPGDLHGNFARGVYSAEKAAGWVLEISSSADQEEAALVKFLHEALLFKYLKVFEEDNSSDEPISTEHQNIMKELYSNLEEASFPERLKTEEDRERFFIAVEKFLWLEDRWPWPEDDQGNGKPSPF
ncbi:hypothetical protein [Jeotgalibacillus aurantiacus]|uniref:hypothetical protein n=1 Tax=Jeotgalibacillus aurantiacus TaxID=2763266 RepID=UPI001D0BD9BE|nr:hypothetical protein [Jeotgalibacillus aurantiacus]